MLAAESPLSSNHLLIQRPKSNRKPLQPKNSPATANITPISVGKKPNWIDIDESNKENNPPLYSTTPSVVITKEEEPILPVESLDASLADELSAIREKLERLRIDKDETEKMLRERAAMLDLRMKEVIQRGEVQKMLEIEMDRLYRLKEIRVACVRVSPLRSLRDKEQEKKVKQDLLKANDKSNEAKDESKSQSPSNSEQVVVDTEN